MSLSRSSVSSILKLPDAHRIVQREVHVVVENRAGGDDPVDEAGLDERNDGGAAQAGRRQRAGEAHADGDIGLQHLLGEKLAAFLETRAVVGQKGVVDEVGELLLAGEILGQDALAGQDTCPGSGTSSSSSSPAFRTCLRDSGGVAGSFGHDLISRLLL